MTRDEMYIQRCFDLAQKGGNNVKSNPLVGAVIVYNDRIIGEGYHQYYGGPHAEVNAINSVKPEDIKLLKKSTIYVSLEPCNHQGKTPPCVQAILDHNFPKVVITNLDPNPLMQGRSVEILRENGVEVVTGILYKKGSIALSRFKANLNKLPYVTLKFARSKDGYIGSKDERVLISGETSQLLTHKIRSQSDAILIGTNTAQLDNPRLNNRLYPGSSPLRVVLDKEGRLDKTLNLFTDNDPTTVLTTRTDYILKGNHKEVITLLNWELRDILEELYRLDIRSLMVEGGASLLKSFVKQKLWHEAYVIENQNLIMEAGVKAPRISGTFIKSLNFGTDNVSHIRCNSYEEVK